MPEYLTPGVFIEEIPAGPVPIEGVSTSTAGFVGRTERGPLSPRLVTSWLDYTRLYGSFLEPRPGGYLAWGLQGFFANGGKRAFVARVRQPGAATAALDLTRAVDAAGAPLSVLTAEALGPGAWGDNVVLSLGRGSLADPKLSTLDELDLFSLRIFYYANAVPERLVDPGDPSSAVNPAYAAPAASEAFDNLSLDPTSPDFILARINAASSLIQMKLSSVAGATAALGAFDPAAFGAASPAVHASAAVATAAAGGVLTATAAQPDAAGDGVKIELVEDHSDPNTLKFTVKVTPLSGPAIGPTAPFTLDDLLKPDPGLQAVSALVSFSTDDPAAVFTPTAEATLNGGAAARAAPPGPFVAMGLGAPAAATLKTAGADLIAEALAGGAWANGVSVGVAVGSSSGTVKVTVQNATAAPEIFDTLTAANLVAAVNSRSKLVRLGWTGAPGLPVAAAPAPLSGGYGPACLKGGADGDAPTAYDYSGANDPPDATPEQRSGLAALETVREVSLLCVPDLDEDKLIGLTAEIVSQCERLGDRVCVLHTASAPPIEELGPPTDTSYGAVYYPWINIARPGRPGTVQLPPSGHVTGVIARTDVARGVFKAPANEVLRGVLAQDIGTAGPLANRVTPDQQDLLNPRGVNCIRDFRDVGRDVRVWGARTMSSDAQWKYLNVRRLFIYVEQSIERGTQWIVFEPNDSYTWTRVVSSVSAFLLGVWRSGALFGATPQEAFFVNCDNTTMSQDDIDNGRLICTVGIAPVRPAEFVIFRFSQTTADAAAS